MGRNVHFCWGKSAVMHYSSVETGMIKGHADDRSVRFFYVLVS